MLIIIIIIGFSIFSFGSFTELRTGSIVNYKEMTGEVISDSVMNTRKNSVWYSVGENRTKNESKYFIFKD